MSETKRPLFGMDRAEWKLVGGVAAAASVVIAASFALESSAIDKAEDIYHTWKGDREISVGTAHEDQSIITTGKAKPELDRGGILTVHLTAGEVAVRESVVQFSCDGTNITAHDLTRPTATDFDRTFWTQPNDICKLGKINDIQAVLNSSAIKLPESVTNQ